MTPEEKAGQLTQYFYMGFMRDQAGDGAPSQPEMVDAAMARSGVGSLLFLTDPAEINRLQRATIAGKLPFSWPRTVGQVPMIYNHNRSHDPDKQWRRYWDEESTPLYPFGHGLGYGSFSYSAPTLSADSITVGDTLTVTVTVTNTGDRSAEEVVQLYLHQRYGTSSRPVRELKGFQRVAVAAGASATVEFTLGPDELRYWSAATRDWVQDATTYELGVGGDSTVELATTFTVTA